MLKMGKPQVFLLRAYLAAGISKMKILKLNQKKWLCNAFLGLINDGYQFSSWFVQLLMS